MEAWGEHHSHQTQVQCLRLRWQDWGLHDSTVHATPVTMSR